MAVCAPPPFAGPGVGLRAPRSAKRQRIAHGPAAAEVAAGEATAAAAVAAEGLPPKLEHIITRDTSQLGEWGSTRTAWGYLRNLVAWCLPQTSWFLHVLLFCLFLVRSQA